MQHFWYKTRYLADLGAYGEKNTALYQKARHSSLIYRKRMNFTALFPFYGLTAFYQPQKQQSMMTAMRMMIQMLLSSNALPKQPAMDTPPYVLLVSDFSVTCCYSMRKAEMCDKLKINAKPSRFCVVCYSFTAPESL